MDNLLENFHFKDNGTTSLADALCAFLKGEISSGHLKAGEPLATIKQLAEMSGLTFRVARGVVERLAKEGYVRSRPRVGTVVLPRNVHATRGRVLLVLPDVDASSYHATQIADALRRRLSSAGYLFSTVVFSQDARRGLAFLRYELANAPDLAIVLYSMPHVRKFLIDAGVRSIFVYGEEPKENDGPWIRFSAENAIASFTEHCKRSGAGHVIQVRFDGNETPDAAPALMAAGISCSWIVIPRWDVLGRYEGIKRSAYETFLEMPQEHFPDVFLFWDDFVAQGALTAFLKRGIQIPKEVKLVVLSNRGLGPVHPEPLTRFECDAAAAGESIADYTLTFLAKGRVPRPPMISPHYVFGGTFPY
ncbi:MAG: LacI family DNA-binding transcriptional regulator [Kiritimatiellae bacterium]|nr:LacI family DNA-binding transcriptional regulator [Kiritimatiellia bacterium]